MSLENDKSRKSITKKIEENEASGQSRSQAINNALKALNIKRTKPKAK